MTREGLAERGEGRRRGEERGKRERERETTFGVIPEGARPVVAAGVVDPAAPRRRRGFARCVRVT